MLTSIRSLCAASLLAGAALAATPAMAQDDTPAISVSGNVALVTDYRFRGVGLSGGDPAIQGGIDVTTAPGFFVGTWASSLDSGGYPSAYGEMELDVYGGWSGEVTDGLSATVGVLYYLYPTNDVGPSDYIEPYASLGTTVGPVSVTVGAAYAPKQDSLGGQDNIYVYTNLGVDIPNTPISLSGHVGYTDGFLTLTSDGTAWDYSVGASVTVLGGLSLGVSYVGVEHTGPSISGVTDDTVVGTLSFKM